MNMNIRKAFLHMLAMAWIPIAAPIAHPHTVTERLREWTPSVAARMQRATAQLKVTPNSGSVAWPNNGVMTVLTYGWGGDRPLPPAMALDSSIIPQLAAPRPPILIVQRRNDNFSPVLQNLLDQSQMIQAMTITIEPIAHETMAYTMWNVRVLGIRNVGQVIEENPVTEEIVFIFDRLTLGDERE
jgi:hypothetical protein